MSIKKALLLASMALAAIAFAVPATASANPTWTHNHLHLEGGEEKTQSFHGPLRFHTPFGSFGCDTTVEITARAGTTATVDKFEPTKPTCSGTGAFTGCELEKGTFNLPWTIHAITNPEGKPELLVTNTNAEGVGDINIHNFYTPGCGVGPTTSTNFGHVLIEPVLDGEGTIETLNITEEQLDTTGAVEATGELHLHDPATQTLGLT